MSTIRWASAAMVLSCSAGELACTLPGASELEGASLVSLGGEPLGALPLVPRLALTSRAAFDPSALWLLRGTVSKKELAQIVAATPTDELSAERVPLSVWTRGSALVLAPLIVLDPNQDYTLVALSSGELARVTTGPLPSPIWWQWSGELTAPGGWRAYCSEVPPWQFLGSTASAPSAEESPALPGEATLEPAGAVVEVRAGLSGSAPSASSTCIRLRVPDAPGTYLPPHELGGRYFEPAPFFVLAGLPVVEPAPAPVHVQGSAASVELRAGVAEVALEGAAEGQRLLVQVDGPSSVLLGLFGVGEYEVRLSFLDAYGRASFEEAAFDVLEERGHPVLSEVLANPLGPEPESEWVEVVNVGRKALDLGGYLLEDADGSIQLPEVTLPPGAVGLVVRSDFVAGLGGDVVPAADTIPIVVPELGKGGLVNGGETLRLRSPGGGVVSEIPAASAAGGRSVARRHLLAPDWESSFSVHTGKGASPGGANVTPD